MYAHHAPGDHYEGCRVGVEWRQMADMSFASVCKNGNGNGKLGRFHHQIKGYIQDWTRYITIHIHDSCNQRCFSPVLDLTPATIAGDAGKKLYAYLAVGGCHLAVTCGEGILKGNRWKPWGAAGITFTCDTAMKCQSPTDSSCSLTFTTKTSQITEWTHTRAPTCMHAHTRTHTHTHTHKA